MQTGQLLKRVPFVIERIKQSWIPSYPQQDKVQRFVLGPVRCRCRQGAHCIRVLGCILSTGLHSLTHPPTHTHTEFCLGDTTNHTHALNAAPDLYGGQSVRLHAQIHKLCSELDSSDFSSCPRLDATERNLMGTCPAPQHRVVIRSFPASSYGALSS